MIGMISDILLAVGALGAGLYCLTLSRRLSRFTDLEKGVGGAVAVLSIQVDELTRALDAAQKASGASVSRLDGMNQKAEEAAARLEILLASMHDLPGSATSRPKVTRRRDRGRTSREAA